MRKAFAVGLFIWFAAAPAFGKPSDADKCESGKLKVAGEYALCLLKADSKFAKTGDAAELQEARDKCDAAFDTHFAKPEGKWGAECPTTGDAANVQQQIETDSDILTQLLSANDVSECTAVCGDGTVEGGEACDAGGTCGAGWCFEGRARRASGTCNSDCLFCNVCRTVFTGYDYYYCASNCPGGGINCTQGGMTGAWECVVGGCQTNADCPSGLTCQPLPALVGGAGPTCLPYY